MTLPLEFQLIVPAPGGAPFAALAAQCDEEKILSIHYLPSDSLEMATVIRPQDQKVVDELGRQLSAYFQDPDSARFDDLLPHLCETPDCPQEVRDAVMSIPCGGICAYSGIAEKIGWVDEDGGWRVGEACGSNPFAIVIPCYRVVSKDKHSSTGFRLGKFSKGNDYVDSETGLKIKRWLLEHEGVRVVNLDGGSLPMRKWECIPRNASGGN